MSRFHYDDPKYIAPKSIRPCIIPQKITYTINGETFETIQNTTVYLTEREYNEILERLRSER